MECDAAGAKWQINFARSPCSLARNAHGNVRACVCVCMCGFVGVWVCGGVGVWGCGGVGVWGCGGVGVGVGACACVRAHGHAMRTILSACIRIWKSVCVYIGRFRCVCVYVYICVYVYVFICNCFSLIINEVLPSPLPTVKPWRIFYLGHVFRARGP